MFQKRLIEGEAAKRDAMKGATVALACSGTVSTELALAGCPGPLRRSGLARALISSTNRAAGGASSFPLCWTMP